MKEQGRKNDKKMKSKGMIKEFKCGCNQCGKIWYYLESEEKRISVQAGSNGILGCTMCCSPIGLWFSNKAIDLQKDLEKMKRCPNCNSTDIIKAAVYHEKKY
jgi:hypothetical protein